MDYISISVIIPVYNCEIYLEKCLKSVLNQTLKQIEIICVDDGSTDHSLNILRSFSEQYGCIRIISQRNGGAGAARNLGLKNAVGEFIAFLDADDFYLDSDALEKMYNMCKRNQVSICGSFGKVLEGNRQREANFYDVRNMRTGVAYEYTDFQMDCGYSTFIYERKLLAKYDVEFPLYRRFQDPPFMVKAMYYGKKFVMADTALYCYRAPNLVNRLNQDKVIDMLKGLYDNLVFALEKQLEILFLSTMRRLENDYVYMILYNLSTDILDKNDEMFLILWNINVVIRSYLGDKTYILRPIKMMMTQAAYYSQNYEKLLDEKIEKSSHIVIYGAGKYAKNFLRYLKVKKVIDKVKYIVVSQKSNNDEQLYGIPVIDIDTYMDKGEQICVFVAVSSAYHQEIADSLVEKKYSSFELMDDSFLGRI